MDFMVPQMPNSKKDANEKTGQIYSRLSKVIKNSPKQSGQRYLRLANYLEESINAIKNINDKGELITEEMYKKCFITPFVEFYETFGTEGIPEEIYVYIENNINKIPFVKLDERMLSILRSMKSKKIDSAIGIIRLDIAYEPSKERESI